MFANKIPLFSILGFRVSLDLTWFLLALLVVWSLARGYFPAVIEGLDDDTALILGLAGALGLFASIILHEFAHALVARRYDIPIKGITLFIFGGVAEMEDEPKSAKSEFLMAIAGPIASYLLAVVFLALALALPEASAGAPMGAVFHYLALINTVLATFNLIPAFPLDGGRVFRAAVWWWTNDLQRATRLAAGTGRVLGAALIVLGLLSVIAGNYIAGIWQALIGLFITAAARSSEFQMVLRSLLADVPVNRLMTADPVAVPVDMPLDDVVETYFYRHSHKVFPVTQGRTLLGTIRLEDVGKLSPGDRACLTAGDVVSRESLERAVTPQSSALDALEAMRRHDTSRLMVTVNGSLEGILTMRDIMSHVMIRREIGAADRGGPLARPPRSAR